MILSGAAVRYFTVYELAVDVRRKAIDELGNWMRHDLLRHNEVTSFPLEDISAAHGGR